MQTNVFYKSKSIENEIVAVESNKLYSEKNQSREHLFTFIQT